MLIAFIIACLLHGLLLIKWPKLAWTHAKLKQTVHHTFLVTITSAPQSVIPPVQTEQIDPIAPAFQPEPSMTPQAIQPPPAIAAPDPLPSTEQPASLIPVASPPTDIASAIEQPAMIESTSPSQDHQVLVPSIADIITPKPSVADIFKNRDQELLNYRYQNNESIATLSGQSTPSPPLFRADVQDQRYANYIEAWRRKVEKIGNLNYPEQAQRQHIYGHLVLRVTIRADGHLEQIQLTRSSGSTILDQAAIRIVKLAAPFAPFSDSMRAAHHAIIIERSWRFEPGDRWQ
jgi:protein TonB